ncbi:MAG: hypothetical protein KAS04_01860 [Candidatus Aenigmarchaeota archaeon]|nr:hypothetical protein [Candidatus Aenigmarchaeota archaeon]
METFGKIIFGMTTGLAITYTAYKLFDNYLDRKIGKKRGKDYMFPYTPPKGFFEKFLTRGY